MNENESTIAPDATGGDNPRRRHGQQSTAEAWRDQEISSKASYPGGFDGAAAYAIAKAYFGWPIGKLLSRAEYQDAVAAALASPIGGSSKRPATPARKGS